MRIQALLVGLTPDGEVFAVGTIFADPSSFQAGDRLVPAAWLTIPTKFQPTGMWVVPVFFVGLDSEGTTAVADARTAMLNSITGGLSDIVSPGSIPGIGVLP